MDFLEKLAENIPIIVTDTLCKNYDFEDDGELYNFEGNMIVDPTKPITQLALWKATVTLKDTTFSGNGTDESERGAKDAALNDCKKKKREEKQKQANKAIEKEKNSLRILLLSADPRAESAVNLQNFNHEVKAKLAIVTGNREKPIDFEYQLAAQATELADGLKATKPKIVHFLGHSNQEGISLMTPNGYKTVPNVGLKALFGSPNAITVRCIVLTGCKSNVTAKTLSEVVDFAIGTDTIITNDEATVFAARFYNEIVDHKSIAEAVCSGNIDLALTGSTIAFELYPKSGANVNAALLV